MAEKRIFELLKGMFSQPHIIEEKTSGIWTYRKYSNGTAFCWGTLNWTSTAMTAWGTCYYSQYSPVVEFPFKFVEKPKVYSVLGTNGIEGWLSNDRKETTTQTSSYTIIRPVATGGTMNLGVHLFVVGKWK